MKFQQRLAFDFPPEVTQKYMTDEKALQYIKDNHPELICDCGGRLDRENPLKCSKCKSLKLDYRMTLIT